jgi:N-methylhydantoinase B
MELIEYQYPLLIHRYGFATDSAGPGEWRGGCGLVHEVEALEHRMTAVVWGEGRKYPASSVGGAQAARPEQKVGRVELVRSDGSVEEIARNCIVVLEPGDRFVTRSAGGGGVGNPSARPPEMVGADVAEGFVSVAGAREEYGVVIDEATLRVDDEATARLRAEPG